MSEFSIGDVAWTAIAYPREVTRPCPVCFGRRAVTVILGDDSQVVTPCDCCGKGYEGPRGVVREYDHSPRAERIAITGKAVEERDGKREVRYFGHEGRYFTADDLFPDEAAALAKAAEKVAAAVASNLDREELRKDGTVRHVSWVIGYHRRMAAEARAEAERHEARAVVLYESKRKGSKP